MVHIQGSHTDNTLMSRVQPELQTALYFSALNLFELPVHLQERQAQLPLDHGIWNPGRGFSGVQDLGQVLEVSVHVVMKRRLFLL